MTKLTISKLNILVNSHLYPKQYSPLLRKNKLVKTIPVLTMRQATKQFIYKNAL